MTTDEVYGYILQHKCILNARERARLRSFARTDPDGAFMRMIEEVETKWRERK